MDKNKEIGVRIEEARKENGMSLQDVADKVSVARSTIQRYEAFFFVYQRLAVRLAEY